MTDRVSCHGSANVDSPHLVDGGQGRKGRGVIGWTFTRGTDLADSGLELDLQTQRIRAYCTLKGLVLLDIITDAGVSGGKPLASREGGQQLLNAIRKRKADAVVMLNLHRTFRNAGDCLSTVEKWERSGVALHVVDLGGNAIDAISAAGRFMLVVLAGAAEMERILTREWTRSAMAIKRANGQRVGTVPYGFDLATNGTTLVANEAEQAVIADIRSMRSRIASLARIADTLSERGVPTKTDKSTRWTHQAVAQILDRMQLGLEATSRLTIVGKSPTG